MLFCPSEVEMLRFLCRTGVRNVDQRWLCKSVFEHNILDLMKQKFQFILLVSFLAISVYGQNTRFVGRTDYHRQTVDMQEQYQKKHRTFKTIGWTSLLVGVGGVGYGLFSDTSQDKAIGALICGGCLVLVSVPMFGLAHSNKQKARSLSLQGRNLASPLPNGSVSYRPGVSLCLNF